MSDYELKLQREEQRDRERWEFQRQIEKEEEERQAQEQAALDDAKMLLMRNGYIVLRYNEVVAEYNKANEPMILSDDDEIPF